MSKQTNTSDKLLITNLAPTILYLSSFHIKSLASSLQEKELALAARRFSECQKTIASLGQKLKSLATLEDFLLDSDNPMEPTCEVTKGAQIGGEKLKLHNSELTLPKKDSESPISLNSSLTNEKSRNGFGKFIPRSKSVSRRGSH